MCRTPDIPQEATAGFPEGAKGPKAQRVEAVTFTLKSQRVGFRPFSLDGRLVRRRTRFPAERAGALPQGGTSGRPAPTRSQRRAAGHQHSKGPGFSNCAPV